MSFGARQLGSWGYGVPIITKTEQVKTKMGLVCHEMDQFLSKYYFISIILVRLEFVQVFICSIRLQIMLVTSMIMFISLLGRFASTATIFVSLPRPVTREQHVSDYKLGRKSETDLYM